MSTTMMPDLLRAPSGARDRDGESADATPLRPVEPLSARAMVVGAVLLVAVGLGAGLLFGVGNSLLDEKAIMVLAGVAGAAVAVAAATRFWLVVVAMFVVRASLDTLKLGHYADGSSSLDPSVVIGLVFLVSGAAWLVAQHRDGGLHRMSATTKWFLGLAAAGSLSAIGSQSLFSSLGVSLKIWAGALMLAVLEQAYLQKPQRAKTILAAGAASVIIPALTAFRQLTSPRELEAYLEVSRINGTFVHANPFCTYLVIVAVMALAVRAHLHGWARVAATVAGGAAGVLALFTYARGGWIALILGVLVIGYFQDKRLIAAVVAGSIAVLLFVPSVTARLSDLQEMEAVGNGDANSLAWRIGYWERLLPMTAENPITGIGLDQVLERSPEKLMPHNTVVQSLVETGVIGLTALVGLIISTAIALRDVIRRSPSGLQRGIAIGSAAACVGWMSQLASENLLTQAAIFWYLAGPLAFVLAARTLLGPAAAADGEPVEADGHGVPGAPAGAPAGRAFADAGADA